MHRLLLGGAALAALPVLEACSTASPAPTAAPSKPAEAAKPAAAPAGQAAPGAGAPAGPDPALIEASKKENKLVWYSPVVEEDKVKLLAAFKEKYPWVDVSEYLRLQTGKLYAKFEPEVQQGVQSADVITLSEIAIAVDAQKKGYFESYVSPEMAKYDKKWKSDPEGLWTGNWINLAGIAWNPNLVKADEAPKTYNDLQYNQYVMIAKLYGDSWWDKMAAQKPVALAGTAQQFEKVVNGELKIVGLAQTSSYAQKKLAGAPIDMLLPKEGVATTMLMVSMVKNAPHPATAKLFIDWILSEEGAKLITQVPMDPVTRQGATPPQLTPRTKDLNVFWPAPEEIDKYIADQPAWRDRWNKLTGM